MGLDVEAPSIHKTHRHFSIQEDIISYGQRGFLFFYCDLKKDYKL